MSLGSIDLFLRCSIRSPRVFGIRARKRMSLRELDLFGVIGLLGVVSVLRAFISRHPRLPRERRKKERKKEREKERKKERDTHPYISFTYPHILTSIFSPFFFGGFSSQQKTHIDRVYHRHACLDELLRCGAVQAHWGKCRRRWTTTLRGGVSSSKASRRRCRDNNKRDSMHARQEAAREKRRVRV